MVVDRVRDRHSLCAPCRGRAGSDTSLLGDELRALRQLKRQSASLFVFASERDSPFTPSGFAKLLARTGEEAEIGY
jgi:hypothetical protein